LSVGTSEKKLTISRLQRVTKSFSLKRPLSTLWTHQRNEVLGGVPAETVHEHARLVAAHELVEVALVEAPGLGTSERRLKHLARLGIFQKHSA